MCLITDKKYLNIVSSMLDRFSWKKSNLATCRCPYCGDSKKHKTKTRGYFYTKNNDMFFRCHNCGLGTTMFKFIENIAPIIAKEYAMDRWKNGENGHSNYKKPEISLSFTKIKQSVTPNILSNLSKVSDLDKNHICVEFVKMRAIPEAFWDKLYYTDNFCKLVEKYGKDKCEHNLSSDSRLIIPIFNSNKELVALQGRTVEGSSVRYLTLKLIDSLDNVWFGSERIDYNKPVYIVEGPLDSLFLPNSIAMIGLNVDKQLPENIFNFTYILDNEPRNKEVIAAYESIIDSGHPIVIWPEIIVKKDINDMVMFGTEVDDILNTVKTNTFAGMEAKMRLIKWKRI